MATVAYLAQVNAFSRTPVMLVKLTIAGDVAGSQVFRFSDKKKPPITLQIGEDVRPYIVRAGGRPTRIEPENALTERANISIQMADDPNAPAFDSAVFSVTTGGSFFRRLVVAQPDFIGSTIEVLRGFVASGFAESDFERVFKGRLESVDFAADETVTLVAKDDLALVDRQVPAQIGDDNKLNGAITASAASITVDNGDEFTDPANLDSKDLFPVILRLEPGAATEEDVVVSSLSSNVFTVQANFVDKSEDFTDALWVGEDTGGSPSTDVTVGPDIDVSPFGGPAIADLISFAATSRLLAQDSGEAAASTTFTFSIWLRRRPDATADETITIRLILDDDTEVASSVVTVTGDWQRFEVTQTFTAGGGQNAVVQILRDTSDGAAVLAFGAQLEKASTRSFYASTSGNAGADAGRGAFGSTAASHSDDADIREVLLYRQHRTDDGVNPVFVLRDLVNRGGVAAADVDQTAFDRELAFVIAAQFKRSGITAIGKPRRLSEHVKEVREQGLIDLWAGEDGKVTARLSFRPELPDVTLSTFSDEDNIVAGSASYRNNAQSRVTRVVVYYNPWVKAEADKPEDFQNVSIVVDLAVESASGQRVKAVFSKWIFRAGEAIAVAGRTVGRFKRGARLASWTLDLKDADDHFVGDTIELDSVDILKKSGSAATRQKTRWQVTQKNETQEGIIRTEALEVSGSKGAFIGPAGLPDFPAATDADKVYAFIGNANNLLDGGTVEGYVII